jgi:hypothetical protein
MAGSRAFRVIALSRFRDPLDPENGPGKRDITDLLSDPPPVIRFAPLGRRFVGRFAALRPVIDAQIRECAHGHHNSCGAVSGR